MELLNNSFEELFVWNRMNTIMTPVCLLIVILCFGPALFVKGHVWIKVLAWLLVAALVIGTVRFNPYRLRGDKSGLEVVHFVGRSSIPAEDILYARRVDRREVDGMIKIFASAGFFGYFGRFRSKSLGNFYMYGASLDNLVLLVTTRGNYLLSSPTLWDRLG